MLNNILKVCVSVLCIYVMSQNDEVKIEAEDKNYIIATDKEVKEVFSQTDVQSRIAYNARNIYETLFEELRVNGVFKDDVVVLGVYVNDDELVLDVNESFIYVGGTLRETEVINRIVDIGLAFDNIKYVTILVEGNLAETSEGINIYKMKQRINTQNWNTELKARRKTWGSLRI